MQCAVTGAAFLWLWARRRRALLVLTHAADVGTDLLDTQMGPLIAALERSGERYFEVRLIPLDATLLRELSRGRQPFLCHASLLGAARLLGLLTFRPRELWRQRLASATLWCLRPRALILIDESGSGQPWLKAARRLGIPSIGIQHGDFQSDNPQYHCAGVGQRAIEPADLLCVWSPWFQQRLLKISPIYHEGNTLVTGRLLHAVQSGQLREQRRHPAEGIVRIRVLLLGESDPDFERLVRPFLSALEADSRFQLVARPHPGSPQSFTGMSEAPGDLSTALAAADVVLGIRSSALLEAVHALCPTIVLAASKPVDPAGYAEDCSMLCPNPADLPEICLRLATVDEHDPRIDHAKARVWGNAPEEPVEAILEAIATVDAK